MALEDQSFELFKLILLPSGVPGKESQTHHKWQVVVLLVVIFSSWLPWQQHAVFGTHTSLIHLFALPAEPRHCQHQNNFPLSNICVEKPLWSRMWARVWRQW